MLTTGLQNREKGPTTRRADVLRPASQARSIEAVLVFNHVGGTSYWRVQFLELQKGLAFQLIVLNRGSGCVMNIRK